MNQVSFHFSFADNTLVLGIQSGGGRKESYPTHIHNGHSARVSPSQGLLAWLKGESGRLPDGVALKGKLKAEKLGRQSVGVG